MNLNKNTAMILFQNMQFWKRSKLKLRGSIGASKSTNSVKLLYRSVFKSATLYLLLISSFLLISTLSVSAQSVQNIEDKLNEQSGESRYLQNLITNAHSNLSIENGTVKIFGKNSPVVLNTEIADLNLLYNENPQFNEIELLKIQIKSQNELNNAIDLTQLVSFDNLMFIYIEFTFDICNGDSDACVRNQTVKLIKGIENYPLSIFYKLSIPN